MAAKQTPTLYYSPGACSLAPHILLHASGLEFKTVRIGYSGITPELLKLNPKGQVPFLQTESGQIVTENPAIFTYISQLAPEKPVLGDDPFDVVKSYEWFSFIGSSVHARRFGAIFRPTRYVRDESLIPMIKQIGIESLDEALQYIDQKVQELPAVDPENLRAVDAYLFVFARWSNGLGLLEKYPNWHKRTIEFSKVKAVQDTIREEGVPLLGK